jgi:dTDP-glucose 4,6-dehydratase
LTKTDWDIIALVRLNYAGDLHRYVDMQKAIESNKRLKFVYHDLKFTVSEQLHNEIGEVDYVLHLAANSHVDRSITHPIEFFYDNVIGTANFFDYLRVKQKGVKKIINFLTDEVFGAAPDDYNYKEDDRWRPSNPYSASKCGQGAIGISYFITYGLPVITTYTMNIFGERQNPEKLLPKAVKYITNDMPIPIHCKIDVDGSVSEIGMRHWLHARNAADALLFLLDKGVVGEHYNVVGDTEKNNLEMVEIIGEILGKKPIITYQDFHSARPGHDRRYALDGTKLKEMGWTPPTEFKASMEKMVEWTLEHPHWLK